MATSQEYMKQLEAMGNMPDYKNVIAGAYDNPVLKPIVNETQQLESQYLPTMFKTFTDIGTSPSDMSAAAKLAMVGKNLGNISSRAEASRNIQDFYNTQIGGLADTASQNWQLQQQKLKDLYGMAYQNEEAARQEAARKAAAAQAAAQSNALMDLYSQQAGGGLEELTVGTPQTLAELNAIRVSKGLGAVDENYWSSTYLPGLQKQQGIDPYASQKPSTWQNVGTNASDWYQKLKKWL